MLEPEPLLLEARRRHLELTRHGIGAAAAGRRTPAHRAPGLEQRQRIRTEAGVVRHQFVEGDATLHRLADESADEDRLGDAVALEGVAKYPVRVKCALLGWMAAKDAIQTYQGNGDGGDEEA